MGLLKEEVVAVQASWTPLVEPSASLFFSSRIGMGCGSVSPLPLHIAIFTKSAYSEYAPGFRAVLLPSQSSFS